MPLIDIIAGARPNFMKVASIIHAFRGRRSSECALQYRLVHTGQHYDKCMSGAFFEQLGIPAPDVNLGVGSGTHAEQTSAIMIAYEQLLRDVPSELCLVVGDVTSTMACSIVAQKLCIPVAHIEAGIRSGDWAMPEEINRIVTDSITNWFFTTSDEANQNLLQCGIAPERIFFVGNTMIDTLLNNVDRLLPPSFWSKLALEPGGYFVLTLHRPSNVDREDDFSRLLTEVCKVVRGMPVIFPVHPRTSKTLQALKNLPPNLCVVEPQPYLEFNYLVKHAKAVITDSGGITEETTVLGVPCLTLRDSTERAETVTIGTNELIGTDPARLQPALDRLFANDWKRGGFQTSGMGKQGSGLLRFWNDSFEIMNCYFKLE